MEKIESTVVVHNIAKRHNVGTMARSATAFGVSELILVGRRDFNAFGSHGSTSHLRFRHFHSLNEAQTYLKEKNFDICGVEITNDSLAVNQHPFRRSTAFLLGNEVPQLAKDALMVSLIPVEVGKPTVRLEKSAIHDGTCRWENPIYETVKFIQELKTGKINEKVYQFIVSTGSSKGGFVGEVTINFADYIDSIKPSTVSLPLKASTSGAILHVVDADRFLEVRTSGDALSKDDHSGGYTNEERGRCLGSEKHSKEGEWIVPPANYVVEYACGDPTVEGDVINDQVEKDGISKSEVSAKERSGFRLDQQHKGLWSVLTAVCLVAAESLLVSQGQGRKQTTESRL